MAVLRCAVAGKLYAPPDQSDAVLIVDPITNATDATAIGGFGTVRGSSKWTFIEFVAGTGKLYASPGTTSAVLIIDPVTNTSDSTTLAVAGMIQRGLINYMGLVFVPTTRKLYAPPYSATGLLVVDPFTNRTALVPFPHATTTTSKWMGAVFVPTTNKVYAAPYAEVSVFILDPVTNETATIAVVPGPLYQYLWATFAFSPDRGGRLYAAPYHASRVLILDPATNTTSNISTHAGNSTPGAPGLQDQWLGIAYAPNVRSPAWSSTCVGATARSPADTQAHRLCPLQNSCPPRKKKSRVRCALSHTRTHTIPIGRLVGSSLRRIFQPDR